MGSNFEELLLSCQRAFTRTFVFNRIVDDYNFINRKQ